MTDRAFFARGLALGQRGQLTAGAKRSTALAMSKASFLTISLAALLLQGCGQSADKAEPEVDPAITNALAGPVMSDPDLAATNQGNAALGGGGPARADIPTELRGPEALSAARAEAARLAGGPLAALPDPGRSTRSLSRADQAVTAAALAEAAGVDKACAARLRYTFAWAGRMPAALPVYPLANVQEAAGADAPGCMVRAVTFVSPVPLGEVAAFYRAMGRKSGVDPVWLEEGADLVLEHPRWVLFARERGDGLGEFQLVTKGL